jgi:DedD protein
VFGFPLVFDSQPRPVPGDIPIEVPDKDKNKPVVLAPAPVGAADVVLAPDAEPAPAAQPTAPPVETEVVVATSKPVDKPVEKPLDKAAESSTPTAEDAKKARALLEAANARGGRFVVQIGAFADTGAARDTRLKLERAGLKTYAHIADTKDGKRTRVRVGPVASLAEADRLAERIKKLDLPAQVLAL